LYFKDADVSKFESVRNTFAYKVFGITTCDKELLIDMSCDGSLKDIFDADKLPQMWLLEKYDYASLSDKAVQVLLPFFKKKNYAKPDSLPAIAMNTKYRLRLIIQK